VFVKRIRVRLDSIRKENAHHELLLPAESTFCDRFFRMRHNRKVWITSCVSGGFHCIPTERPTKKSTQGRAQQDKRIPRRRTVANTSRRKQAWKHKSLNSRCGVSPFANGSDPHETCRSDREHGGNENSCKEKFKSNVNDELEGEVLSNPHGLVG